MRLRNKIVYTPFKEEHDALCKSFTLVRDLIDFLEEKEFEELYDESNGNVIDLDALQTTLGTLDSLKEELTLCEIL